MRMISCDDRSADFIDVFRKSAMAAGYQVDILRPQGEGCARFRELVRHYRHFSPNPEQFELASFRRWFEIAAVAGRDERFILADSDLIIFLPWAQVAEEIRDEAGVVGSIGVTNGTLEDGVNGGFSMWTGKLLSDFCDAIVGEYRSGSVGLEALYQEKLASGNPRASISDMTVLYRWIQDSGTRFLNTNRLFSGAGGTSQYIDHNFFMPEAIDVRFDMALGRKRLRRDRAGVRLCTAEGEPVQPISLHLGGRYKILSRAIYEWHVSEMTAKSLYIWGGRTARSLMAKAGLYV